MSKQEDFNCSQANKTLAFSHSPSIQNVLDSVHYTLSVALHTAIRTLGVEFGLKLSRYRVRVRVMTEDLRW